ncbi:maleylacetate reductase [Pseudomonas nitroreducens]|uniref:maleylacetate reductase n=1 Tax=Pseudomonas nitroreducens TaxID=46680 RepID=UPI0014753B0B|nr:maleylacetate reductase [Pseudomonas nitroreducens]MDG9856908.1 maleylacetate reductase [Pseudomonas nitroreducens]MDH1075833.1 maleylacetate reductase [Pseudomonas nitroreducens]NMZ76444.1 maleylacetate reductase [Pseudomonas nitroreducens]
MDAFVYQSLPIRVIFGWNRIDALAEEIERLGARRALILTTPEQRELGERIAGLLGERSAGVYPQAVMHVPVEVAQAACEEAKRLGADCCVAVGGGSTIGLGKAIALEFGLPILAIPTTYAGSEMTPIYGLTDNRLKRTGRDVRVLPRTVIYDPQFSLSLPADISACSGMNAMAHAIEALYAEDANPIVSLMAEDSIRALAEALPTIVDDPQDRQARGRALYGAWLAGICLGSVGMAIHHKLCHTLGGTFNLPHAQSHAVLLPYSVNYNRDAARPALERAARALGGSQAEEVGGLLYALNRRIGVPTSLAEIGFPPEGPAETARIACSNPYYNPRPFEADAIQALLERARAGMPPA